MFRGFNKGARCNDELLWFIILFLLLFCSNDQNKCHDTCGCSKTNTICD